MTSPQDLAKNQSLQFCDDVILHEEWDLLVLSNTQCDQYVINMWSMCVWNLFAIQQDHHGLPWPTMAYHSPPWPTIAHWPTRISACPLWPFSWGHQCTCRARCQETYPWSHQSPHLGTLIIWAAFDTSLKKNKIYDHTTINNLPICNECGCMHIYIYKNIYIYKYMYEQISPYLTI